MKLRRGKGKVHDLEPKPPSLSAPLGWVKRHKVWSSVIGVLVAATIIGNLTSSGQPSATSAATTPTPAPTATETVNVPEPGVTATVTTQVSVPGPTVTATVTAQPPPPSHHFAGDGTFLVGKDVIPGTYKAAASPGCYWSLNGSGANNILANDNTDGQAIIQVSSSAFSVTTQGCATFYLVG